MAYVSTAASDANGLYTVNNVPAGIYTVKTGPTNTGAWTATGDTNYTVDPIDSGGSVVPAGLTGAVAATRYVGATTYGKPTTGTFALGDYVVAQLTGTMYVCSAAGSPGTWTSAGSIVSVLDYGAKFDGQTIANGVMNGTTAVLTSASNPFAATDVGKTIIVYGAAATGLPLSTTIASYQSAGQVTLTAVSATAVGAATVYWGTDDTAAINAALTAVNVNAVTTAVGGRVTCPTGIGIVTGLGLALRSNTTFEGTGRNTILAYAGNVASPNVIGSYPGQNIAIQGGITTNLTVRNLSIVGAPSTQYGVAGGSIYFGSATGILIHNVYVNGNNSIAIRVNASINVMIYGCEVQNCAGGIWVTESATAIIAHNLSPGGLTDDCYVTYGANNFDTTDITIVGNTAIGVLSPAAGISVGIASAVTSCTKDVRRFAVIGNTVRDAPGNFGINVGGASRDGQVVGNTLQNCAVRGIWIGQRTNGAGGPFSPTNIVIADNVISSTTSVVGTNGGIVLEATTTAPLVGIKVANNRVYNAGNAGIFLHANGANTVIRKCSVIGNDVQDTHGGSASGIYVYADGNGSIIEHLTINDNVLWDSGGATQLQGININLSGTGTVRTSQITNNDLGATGTAAAISGGVTNDVVFRNNKGWNPRGTFVASGTAAPATTVTTYNSNFCDCIATIVNGANAMTVAIAGGTVGILPANALGTFFWPASQSIVLTYGGGAPTWSVVGAA